MDKKLQDLIIGFHGCCRDTAEKVISGSIPDQRSAAEHIFSYVSEVRTASRDISDSSKRTMAMQCRKLHITCRTIPVRDDSDAAFPSLLKSVMCYRKTKKSLKRPPKSLKRKKAEDQKKEPVRKNPDRLFQFRLREMRQTVYESPLSLFFRRHL